MSYRNPQIIVDRSAEIWAQGMSQFAANIAQGFSNYVEIKKEAKRKDDFDKKHKVGKYKKS